MPTATRLNVPSGCDSTSVILTRQPIRNSDCAPCSPISYPSRMPTEPKYRSSGSARSRWCTSAR